MNNEAFSGPRRRLRRGSCRLPGLVVLVVLAVAGCVVNPVTGQSEIALVSTEQEIGIGKQQYVPSQQMQGGRYLVDPKVAAYVQQVGNRLAAQSDRQLPYEFVVLNNSVPNAWALPGGKLAVNRGLLVELRNEAELAAVLGHEIVHAAARHGAKTMERGLLAQIGLAALAIGTQGTELGGTVVGMAQTGAQLINQKYGRDAEREADYYGTRYMAKAGYDPYAAVTLQETFVKLSEGRESNWVEGLFASHPPSAERVANNRQLVAQLRAEGYTDGEFGAEAYQNAMRQLKQDADAYKAADDARKALAKDDYKEAERLVGVALAGQPAEAQFHGLRGDIRLAQKRYGDARTNYQRAIERDPEYFAYYLGRGIANSRDGERSAAKSDLNHSVELLPTSVAYNELGRIAEAEGDTAAALRYYQEAGGSGDAAGEAARANALRLDVARQPGRYVQAAVSRDSAGRLLLEVGNPTSATLYGVQVRVDAMDAAGRVRSVTRTLERVQPGTLQRVLVTDQAADFVDARATVLSARAEP